MVQKTKQRRTFTISANILNWIDKKAQETNVSRSELVDRLLEEYRQRERSESMKEGYEALRDVLKDTAEAALPLQKKIVADY